MRSEVRVIFRFCEAKRPSQSGTSGKNGADQIRKPLEGDGIHPQIGEAGRASFFGFAKQNVRLVRDEWENGADQIRKPLEEDGIHPQIGEAGCASIFGFAKQNVRPNPGRAGKRRRPDKKTARRRRHTATNRRSRVRVIFRFCEAKRPSSPGRAGKTAQTK